METPYDGDFNNAYEDDYQDNFIYAGDGYNYREYYSEPDCAQLLCALPLPGLAGEVDLTDEGNQQEEEHECEIKYVEDDPGIEETKEPSSPKVPYDSS